MTPERRGAPTVEGGGTDCLGVLVVVPELRAFTGGHPVRSGGSSPDRHRPHGRRRWKGAGCLRRSVLSNQMTRLSAVIA